MLDNYSHIEISNTNILALLRVLRDNKLQEQSKEQKNQVVIQHAMAMESELMKIAKQLEHDKDISLKNQQIYWKIIRYIHKNIKNDILQLLEQQANVQNVNRHINSSISTHKSRLNNTGSTAINQSVQLSPRTIKLLEKETFNQNNETTDLFNSALNALYDIPSTGDDVEQLPEPVPKIDESIVKISGAGSKTNIFHIQQQKQISPQRSGSKTFNTSQNGNYGSHQASPMKVQSPTIKINQLMDQMDKLTAQNIELIKKQSEYQKTITQISEELQVIRAQNEQLKSKNKLLKAENDQLHANTLHSESGREQLFGIQDQINAKISQIISIQSLQSKKFDQNQFLVQIARQMTVLKQLYVNELNQKSPTKFNDQIEQMLQTKLQQYQVQINSNTQSSKTVRSQSINIQNSEKTKQLMSASLNNLNASQSDLLDQEVNRILSKFGQRMPQLRKTDKNKWIIERNGKILTLQLNDRGIVIVVNDGQPVNKTPLSVYLKGVVQNQRQQNRQSQ